MTKTTTNEATLFNRLKRSLAKDGQTLHKCRVDSRHYGKLGRYYVADQNNVVSAQDIDLETWLAESA